MSTKNSLSQYVGIGLFLTILAVFFTYGQARGTDISLEFLGFVLAFSAIHTTITYFMIQKWMAYATHENTSSRKSGSPMDE